MRSAGVTGRHAVHSSPRVESFKKHSGTFSVCRENIRTRSSVTSRRARKRYHSETWWTAERCASVSVNWNAAFHELSLIFSPDANANEREKGKRFARVTASPRTENAKRKEPTKACFGVVARVAIASKVARSINDIMRMNSRLLHDVFSFSKR